MIYNVTLGILAIKHPKANMHLNKSLNLRNCVTILILEIRNIHTLQHQINYGACAAVSVECLF